MGGIPWIFLESRIFQLARSVPPEVADGLKVELMVRTSVKGKIVQGQSEKPVSRGQAGTMHAVRRELPMQLKMNKGTGALDQTFIESVVRGLWSSGQPEFFEHIMGFIVILAVETGKIGHVVGIEAGALAVPDQFRDFRGFFTHGSGLAMETSSTG
jgi:hypothetical protein